MTTFEDYLRENGELVYSFRGTSMMPFLRQKTDLVIVKSVAKGVRLKKYDVPLYKKSDGRYILHRVVKVTEVGYVIRGDNCYSDETDVTDESIVAVMTARVRKGKITPVTGFWYRLYSRSHVALYPLRRTYVMCRRIGGRAKRKILRLLKNVRKV